MFRAMLVTLVLTLPMAPAVAGQAQLDFVSPQSFRDPEFRRAPTRDAALSEVQRWFQDFAARDLPPGQTLRVQIHDIDLAGEFEPWRSDFRDVRILRDVTPPRIRFDWQLQQDGQIIRQGRAKLTDMNYLSDVRARSGSARDGRFPHDRLLVQDWFRKTFPAT